MGVQGLDLQLAKATLAHSEGRLQDAKLGYVAVLKENPKHVGALLAYAALMKDTDKLPAAVSVYGEILALQPRNGLAHAGLGDALWTLKDREGARTHFESALEADPACVPAHQGLARILRLLGQVEAAAEHERKGFAGQPVYSLPFYGGGQAPTILVLYAGSIGNIPLDETIDNTLFRHLALMPEYFVSTTKLPPHDVVFNAIGDADLCQEVLAKAGTLLKATKAPILNPPERVALTGRADNAARLGRIKGLLVPRTAAFTRAELEASDAPHRLEAAGFRFPLLLRAQGFHAGEHFTKLDAAAALAPALAAMPGRDFHAIQFVDARGPDGHYRKYRVMMIDGGLYPLHAAISPQWKVHYFSADMRDNAAHRREDEAFLLDMPGVLGKPAMDILKAVQDSLGLDYAGMDFGLSASGEVLLYEANATMAILRPEDGEQWDYRRAPVQRAVDAVNAMLRARIDAKNAPPMREQGIFAKNAAQAADKREARLERRLARAAALQAQGRLEEARDECAAVLERDPKQVDALARYGDLLRLTGRDDEAATAYIRLLTLQPRNSLAHALLGTLLLQNEHPAEGRVHIDMALELDPDCPQAHQGLSQIYSEQRDQEKALEHGRKGYTGRASFSLPYRGGSSKPLTVLTLNTTALGNIPLDKTIDTKRFRHTKVLVDYFDPQAELPPHDVVINAVGDADLCPESLLRSEELIRRIKAPVLNLPDKVRVTGRADNARRLAGITGLVVPKVLECSRAVLAGPEAQEALAARGLAFPLLLRAQGFQGGKHFEKLDSFAQLAPALEAMPGDEFHMIQYMDSRSPDGDVRKYRVMMIGGRLLPLHAAISGNWKVHYFSADMRDNAEHRREDEAFLLDMPGVLGAKAMRALAEVQKAQGLDYAGIDFSLTPEGEVLLFETNATMVIAHPGADQRWDYRREPVRKILDAVNDMLAARCAAADSLSKQ
jgi:tetratricopeptide (TPR) repeat protein